MPLLFVSFLLSAILYLLPGFLLTLCLDIRPLRLWDRLVLSLCLSLVIVPYTFQVTGSIHWFIPGLAPLAILCALLAVAAGVLIRLGKRPRVHFPEYDPQRKTWRIIEEGLIWLFLAVFAAIVNLPRLDMLLQGARALLVLPADEPWHLAELTAVARSGIPPMHYLFPTLKLAYYYASWIYPAILGNLPGVEISLARSMAIHVYLTVFAFLGMAYFILRASFKNHWVRRIGLALLTVAGGFDVYVGWPNTNPEYWTRVVGWLQGGDQVSQFSTTYTWVPQHLGAALAVLILFWLWFQVRMNRTLKIGLMAVVTGYGFTTSPFVIFSALLAAGIYALSRWRQVWEERRQVWKDLALFLVLFLAVAWYPLWVYSQHQSSIGLNDFHLTLFETYLSSPKALLLDYLITWLGFPVITFWLGLIDLGLAFLLYLAWLVRRWQKAPLTVNPQLKALFLFYPPLFYLISFFLTDYGGGGGLIMRGMIPVQVLIVLAGLTWLEEIDFTPRHRGPRFWLLGYGIVCFLAAQAFSAGFTILNDSNQTLELVRKEAARGDLFAAKDKDVSGGAALPWPQQDLYIRWLNQNTPRDALIMEVGCLKGDDSYFYRFLERSRFIRPECSANMELFERDRDFILRPEWLDLKASSQTYDDMLPFFEATSYRQKNQRPVYVVSWNHDPIPGGELVYSDADVDVYRLEDGDHSTQ